MSVDERLRIGLSRNALSLDPDVDTLLEATLARRRRDRRIRWAGAAAGVLAAACAALVLVLSGGWGADRSAPPMPAESDLAGGIPDGAWEREVTTAEIARRGLTLGAEEITSNYLDDGSVLLVLKMQGSRWALLVEDDAGAFEVGDLGETSYDAEGRWVQASDSNGGVVVLAWELSGNTLTTSGLMSQAGNPIDEDGARLFLEGTWQRQAE